MPGSPLLTVCVCTHNRPHYLRDCLDGLRRQTAPRDWFEVVVVDSASTAANASILPKLVALLPNARLLRAERPGLCLARNVAARAARAAHICYIDDDAIPEPDWISAAVQACADAHPAASLIGGRILPQWEAPLPAWWPPRLRGVLSIVECDARGEYRTSSLPPGTEPCGANLIVHVPTLLAAGGFLTTGRYRDALLSDEEVQLAWRLQDAGHSIRYDPRIVVRHQIQAARLTPPWLLSRLHWQGISTVLTRRLLGKPQSVWRELPRRMLVAALFAPVALVPRSCTRLIGFRWRLAYAVGFIRGAIGWHPPGLA